MPRPAAGSSVQPQATPWKAAIGDGFRGFLERTIDVHIKTAPTENSRKPAETGELIETVRSIGYRFRERQTRREVNTTACGANEKRPGTSRAVFSLHSDFTSTARSRLLFLAQAVPLAWGAHRATEHPLGQHQALAGHPERHQASGAPPGAAGFKPPGHRRGTGADRRLAARARRRTRHRGHPRNARVHTTRRDNTHPEAFRGHRLAEQVPPGGMPGRPAWVHTTRRHPRQARSATRRHETTRTATGEARERHPAHPESAACHRRFSVSMTNPVVEHQELAVRRHEEVSADRCLPHGCGLDAFSFHAVGRSQVRSPRRHPVRSRATTTRNIFLFAGSKAT